MTGPRSYILVDANIAKSAADPARHPTTIACLRLARALEARSCRTGAAMTPALQEEWKRHASRTMVAWLASMESRGRVRREADRRVNDLRAAVTDIKDGGVRAAIQKDIHLSEAAIYHGFPVASQDDRQRKFLAQLSTQYALAGQVQWINPVTDPDAWEDWLVEGCIERDVHCCSGAA